MVNKSECKVTGEKHGRIQGGGVTGVTSHPLAERKKLYYKNITSQATLLANEKVLQLSDFSN